MPSQPVQIRDRALTYLPLKPARWPAALAGGGRVGARLACGGEGHCGPKLAGQCAGRLGTWCLARPCTEDHARLMSRGVSPVTRERKVLGGQAAIVGWLIWIKLFV